MFYSVFSAIVKRVISSVVTPTLDALSSCVMAHVEVALGPSYAETGGREVIVKEQPVPNESPEEIPDCLRVEEEAPASHSPDKELCRFCGSLEYHNRSMCPAQGTFCSFCNRRGHFRNVCERMKRLSGGNPVIGCAAFASPHACASIGVSATTVTALLNGMEFSALVDTGSTYSFISSKLAKRLGLSTKPQIIKLTLASSNKSVSSTSKAQVSELQLCGFTYENIYLSVMDSLCSDILIGHDLLSLHKNVVVQFGGEEENLIVNNTDEKPICSVARASIEPVSLFHTLDKTAKPIACKSRRYNEDDKEFIREAVAKLKESGIVEDSCSPWRAQVLVAKNENDWHRKRMVVDYSRTVNKFTDLDAYPLPLMDEMVLDISKHKIYSTFDLKSAYHQIPLAVEERPYTAFEADGELLQFTSIPYGVTNGPPAFQKTIAQLCRKEGLELTWPFMDNVTIGGDTQEEHDANKERFYELVKKYGLTLNHSKSIISVTEINILGFLVSHLTIRPDPERMRPLLNLPLPEDLPSLRRVLGLFSYYSKWVHSFSDKVKPLSANDPKFPLSDDAIRAFEQIKRDVAKASLACPNGRDILVIETDASDVALSATLNQNGRPIAFFSRTLQPHEQKHPAIEKEAAAIIEACRKWYHYLCCRKFRLITDQQSVSFIFSPTHGKTKNQKIERWRAELSCLDFEIKYRPGSENAAADCLSRVVIAAVSAAENTLKGLHEGLVHPGEGRLYQFVRARNLPYSMEDVKKVVSQCRICAKIKPRFYRPVNPPLIKATQPFERLAVDFKGPLPSVTQNRYILTVVDEFSRFPWAFPSKDMTTKTVSDCLDEIFSMCGQPGYIHSDNGPAFVSEELHKHLTKNSIGHSFSSVYNPRGNGQVERYNGTIWRGVQLALESDGLEAKHWESALRTVLHSIRSLVCTSTNCTPHERLFRFERRTMTGHALPTWLMNKERALVRKQVRQSKYDDWVEECEILHVTPSYAQIRTSAGKEQTVSLRDLAPLPQSENVTRDSAEDQPSMLFSEPESVPVSTRVPSPGQHPHTSATPPLQAPQNEQAQQPAPSAPPVGVEPRVAAPTPAPRRSERSRTDVVRLNYDSLGGSNACNFIDLFRH